MFARRTLRHVTAWLAALAVLMAALLPALSHAVMSRLAATNGGLVEVCTVSGMAWVSADASSAVSADTAAAPGQSQTGLQGSGSGDTGMVMAGCDWCATHAPGWSLPPVAALSLPLPVQLADVPLAFLHAPRLLAVWASAHSRAPPSAA